MSDTPRTDEDRDACAKCHLDFCSVEHARTLERENAALREALEAYEDAYPHHAPDDCFATGPRTGNDFADLVICPGCVAQHKARAALSAIKGDK